MITKSDLANRIADQLGTSRAAADRYLAAVLNAIEHAVEHEGGVAIPRFGTFALKTRPERTARNPRTGESVTVAYPRQLSCHSQKGYYTALPVRPEGNRVFPLPYHGRE